LPADFPAQVLHQAQVPEGLDPADNLPRLIFEQRRANGDGDLFAIGPQDSDRLADHRFARIHGLFQDAGGFTDIGPEDLAARPAQGLRRCNAGNLFGGPVEASDPPVEIHREDAVDDAIQDDGGLAGQDRLNRSQPRPLEARAAAFDG
jgi:hypothetical protein